MTTTIHIPAGTYLIGDETLSTSRPQHPVTLNSFSIAQYAVSNQQFAEFVSDGGYRDESLWTEMGWRWQSSKQIAMPHFWVDAKFSAPQQPVVGVSWYTAMAYCAWYSRTSGTVWTLPSEAQWEAAVRNASAETSSDESYIHSAEKGIGRTILVDDGHMLGNGLVNILGNVWEWTLSRWGRNWQTLEYGYPYVAEDGREDVNGSYARVMRGGSWFDPVDQAKPAFRARYLPGSRASNIGFRMITI